MRAADLREKSVEDLRELQKSLASDVFQNRLKNFTNRLDDTSAIPKSKRDLARVVTLLRERELGVVRVAKPTQAPKAKAPKAKAEAPAKAAPAAEPAAKPKKAAAKKAAAAPSEGEAAGAKPKKKSSATKSEAK
jgi:large subunit ribosomal protein L29